jgi:hypothetical protein
MGLLGSLGDAAALNDMQEETKIDEIEPHETKDITGSAFGPDEGWLRIFQIVARCSRAFDEAMNEIAALRSLTILMTLAWIALMITLSAVD